MSKVHEQAPSRSPQAQDWIDANLLDQDRRQGQIIENMDRLGPERERWVEAFLMRLQTRGFNYDCDQKRLITAEDLPEKPKRPFKVVF